MRNSMPGKGKLEEAWLPAVTEWYKIIEAGCLTPDMLGLSYDQALDEFRHRRPLCGSADLGRWKP